MTTALLVAVIVTAALITTALLLRKRRGRAASAPGEPEVARFHVVALGPPGSGKTTLLTSMYQKLKAPGDRGYYLAVPPDQVVELDRWHRHIANPDQDWLTGTARGDMREFRFNVMAQDSRSTRAAFKLEGYWDYPGELLTDVDTAEGTARSKLTNAIRSADAVFCIVDGLRVRQAFQQDEYGTDQLTGALDAMSALLVGGPVPVVFIISKWDLLLDLNPDEDIRLATVRQRLMEHPAVRELVVGRVVRLLPVSAIGPGFADLDENSVIKKKSEGDLAPVNTDMPLSAIIPDIFEQQRLNLNAAASIAAAEPRRPRLGLLAALGALLRFGLTSLWRPTSGLGLFLPPGADTENGQRGPGDPGRPSEAERADAATRQVLRRLRHQTTMFETRLPSSRL